MTEHLLVESQGPWAGRGCATFVRDAAALARTGAVTLLLMQDAVIGAMPGELPELTEFVAAPGELWLDRFSVDQRGLREDRLLHQARLVDMNEVAAAVLDPAVKVVWH